MRKHITEKKNFELYLEAFCRASKLNYPERIYNIQDIWLQDKYGNSYYIDSGIIYTIGKKLVKYEEALQD